jgi:molybdenum cofactor cytidylyltransferase
MNLLRALRLSSTSRIAFVGAGGKTSAIFIAGRQLLTSRSKVKSVFVTTTTHLSIEQIVYADHHLIVENKSLVSDLLEKVPDGLILLTGPIDKTGRVRGLESSHIAETLEIADKNQIPLLIEADGSRMLPLKAPDDHEPVIPSFVDTVVVVAGLSGMGKVLSPENVHRSERFGKISGLSQGSKVTPEAMVDVLLHPNGGLKNIPDKSRPVALLNQADTPEIQAVAKRLVNNLLPTYHAVVIAALIPGDCLITTQSTSSGERKIDPHIDLKKGEVIHSVHEPVSGVILAGGGSIRFGKPKQLLNWQGETFIQHVAKKALRAGLSPVIIVTGADADQVSSSVEDLDVQIVYNSVWKEGQSTSIKAGIQSLPRSTGAVIFHLVDQPQIPLTLIRALADRHHSTLAHIIAPMIDGQRGNPILFDRDTFDSLLSISGDQGGRSVFHHYRIEWLSWPNSNLLLDVDSPEDYLRLLKLKL